MNAKDIDNIGDLIRFLSDFDHNKKIFIYDYEWGTNKPLQHIDIEDDYIVIYD